jgi:hypothetical protein
MTPDTSLPDGSRDFDFWMGRWHVTNRRLPRPLQGCVDWEHFQATSHAVPLPGGIGNYDDFIAPDWRPGYVGMSLRIYNPQTALWSIYWLTNRTGGLDPRSGHLTPPVVGRFVDGVGVFEGSDELDGRPIRVRYTWSDIRPRSARWQQAFSPDDGESWEVNWFMQMERIQA